VDQTETGGLDVVQGKGEQDNPVHRDKGAQGFENANPIGCRIFKGLRIGRLYRPRFQCY
jgi:hypothetical protein